MQWTWAKYGWINPIVINLWSFEKIFKKIITNKTTEANSTCLPNFHFHLHKSKIHLPQAMAPVFFSCPALWSWQPTLESVWLINITLHKLQVIDQSIDHFPHIAGKITCPEHDYQSDTLSAWLFLLGRVAVPQETQNLGLSLDIVTLLCWLVRLFGVFHKFSTCQRCIR